MYEVKAVPFGAAFVMEWKNFFVSLAVNVT